MEMLGRRKETRREGKMKAGRKVGYISRDRMLGRLTWHMLGGQFSVA
jgi:hypothetical protein